MKTIDLQSFKTKAKKKVDQIDTRLSELDEKKESIKNSIKPEIERKLQYLQEQKEELSKKYDSFKDAHDINWDIVHESFENTANFIEEGIEELKAIF